MTMDQYFGSRKNQWDTRILATDISTATLAKLSKNEPVSMEVLYKFCQLLKCDIGDIVEFKGGEQE